MDPFDYFVIAKPATYIAANAHTHHAHTQVFCMKLPFDYFVIAKPATYIVANAHTHHARTQVFCMKLPFDYFVIAKPATGPLTFVQMRGWLECGSAW